jgi:surface carbohydrate biosynthesis protein
MKFSFNLSKLSKVDVLIYDDCYSNLDIPKKIKALTIKKNEVFLFIFLQSLILNILSFNFSIKKLIYSYYKLLIKKIRPSIIVSHELKSNIFKFKKDFPNIITIVYQLNNYFDYFKNVTNEIINKDFAKSDFKCDYLILKNKHSYKYLNFIKSKKIILGSIKNNEIKTNSYKKKKYDIMFASTFRKKVYKFFGLVHHGFLEMSDASSTYILNMINQLILSKNLKVCIAFSSLRSDKKNKLSFKDEKEFYQSNLKKFYVEKNIDSYQLAEKSKIIINVGSSLGLDLISRGHKVLFLQPISFAPADLLEMISKKKKEGSFWYKGTNNSIIQKKIMRLILLSQNKWKKTFKKNAIQAYDQNNIYLKNLISKILKVK